MSVQRGKVDETKVALMVALRAHYRGVLATRLGLGLANQYAGEASRIARGPLLDVVRGSRSAFGRAAEAARSEDVRCRVEAEEELRLVYPRLSKKLHARINDRDTEAFWRMIDEAIRLAKGRAR